MEIDKIRGLISVMKLQDKIALVGGGNGIAALDRPKLAVTDMGEYVLPYFAAEPSQLALGCTFSPEICAAVSKARSVEAASERSAFSSAVGCGLIRDPMKQDAAQFFSEDAVVAAELLKGYATGCELGCLFTDALGQGRFVNRTIDSRALNELYLYPLKTAGKYAAALQLDGGYLNGEYVCTSRSVADKYIKYLSNDAMLVTQFGAVGGVDGIMGNGAYQLGADEGTKKEIARAVSDGTVTENRIDGCIERTLAFAVKTTETLGKRQDDELDDTTLANLVYNTTVLLKNDGVLPVKKTPVLFGDASFFDDGDKYAIKDPLTAPEKFGDVNIFLITDYEKGVDAFVMKAIAKTAAEALSIVVLCGGVAVPLPFDELVGAVMYCPYSPSVAAIVAMVCGVSPRGHLPFSWCADRDAYPCNNAKFAQRGDFRYESMYNGYLLFNNFMSRVRYPFGHGLDYTTYDINKLNVRCDDLDIKVDFVIKNKGERSGSPVVQVYLTAIGGQVYGYSKRLVAFKRVDLGKTENALIELNIDLADFAAYDEQNDAYIPVGGRYRIDVGLSSADIRASAEIKVPFGSRVKVGLSDTAAPAYYKTGGLFEPTAPQIEKLLKVPFIKKADDRPDIDPPSPSNVKRALKKAEKTVPPRLMGQVKYKIEHTPDKYGN